ncbi:MAG: TIGR03619 family F420-dependent LLM class oxidoreductase [Acidimicrobiia bacterium]
MKFGIQHASGDPNWGPGILAPGAVAAFARAAEECGYAAIAFTDHPAPSTKWIESGGEGVADPFSALGFCAAVTTSIRLLTYVLVPAYRNPFVAAHQVATLDVLSGGRVTLGLGAGYLRGEFRAVGADLERRRSTFDEHLDVMREAWAGHEVARDTSTFSAPGNQVLPRPEQRPHPPLWIHGNGPWASERAARDLQGCIFMIAGPELVRTIRTLPIADLDALARRLDQFRRQVEANGRAPDDVEVVVTGAWSMLDVRAGWSVDERLAQVAELERLGVDWVVSTCCGDDPAAAEETVRAFGEQVVQAD